MTDCNKCRNINTSICSKIIDVHNCKEFTYDDLSAKEAKMRQINANTKDDLYRMFFYTLRMYLDPYSPHNNYNDMTLYYSIDQNKLLKRHTRNSNDIGNWIEVKFNIPAFLWLKEQLEFTNPRKSLSIEYGRKVPDNYAWIKDDVWVRWMRLVRVTFDQFYNENNAILDIKSKSNQDNATTKPLF